MIRLVLSGIMFLITIVELVLSQPDLCRNPRLDSIAYMAEKKMYFFTSGGYYWHLKESEFPPTQDKAKPLPNGFKIGEAAVYKNTLETCASSSAPNKPQEQEIYLFEKTAKGNQFMIYDVRAQTWKEPTGYASDHTIGRAQIDWENSINAMFEFKPNEIYVVQGTRYAAVDYTKICTNPDDYASPLPQQSTDNLGTQKTIDAMTFVAPKSLYMFIGDQFWISTIIENSSKNGKIMVTKYSSKPIKRNFFKFPDECPPASASGGSSPSAVDAEQSAPDPGVQPSDSSNKDESSDSKSGGVMIIGGVITVLIIIVVVIIGVSVFLLMNKKKTSDLPAKTDPEPNKVSTTPKAGGNFANPTEKVISKVGTAAAPNTAPKSTVGQKSTPSKK